MTIIPPNKTGIHCWLPLKWKERLLVRKGFNAPATEISPYINTDHHMIAEVGQLWCKTPSVRYLRSKKVACTIWKCHHFHLKTAFLQLPLQNCRHWSRIQNTRVHNLPYDKKQSISIRCFEIMKAWKRYMPYYYHNDFSTSLLCSALCICSL